MTEMCVLLTYRYACVFVCMYMPLLTKYSKWFTCISCVCALFLCLHLSVSILYFVLFTFHSVLSVFALAPLSLANLICATDRMR